VPRPSARPDPADFTDRDNWHGGYYELAVRLGPRSDPQAEGRLRAAFVALWDDPRLDGCYLEARRRPRQPRVPAASIEPADVQGLVRLPKGGRVVCASHVIRETADTAGDGEQPHDWVDLSIPLGALGRADRRVGGYPFEEDSLRSLEWRAPLDAWLFEVARRVFGAAPFTGALIGFEVSGADLDPAPVGHRHVGYAVPQGGRLVLLPADR
jgi:hypothetical protein